MTLNAYHWDNPPFHWDAPTEYAVQTTETSGIEIATSNHLVVTPASSSTGISFTRMNKMTTNGESITGAGHVGACINYTVVNASGKTIAATYSTESKLDNTAGTITNAIVNEVQLASNGGTITNLFLNRAYIEASAGTISNTYAYYIDANLSSRAGGTAYSFYNADAAAPFLNMGITWLDGAVRHKDYTVATTPSAVGLTGYQISVTDGAAGNEVMARSDGTNWIKLDGTGAVIASS